MFKISIKDLSVVVFFVTNINMKVHHVNTTCCFTCRKIPGINEYVKKLTTH